MTKDPMTNQQPDSEGMDEGRPEPAQRVGLDDRATVARSGSFTPGPWVSEESEIFTAGEPLLRIAETVPLAGDPQDIPGFGRMELANARLIAAAPDLYEAARDALESMLAVGVVHDGDIHANDPAVAKLRAALSRAEGVKQ